MTVAEVPTVMSVKQLGGLLNKSRSWLYAEWAKPGNTLPSRFKIGSSTRIMGADAIRYLNEQASSATGR